MHPSDDTVETYEGMWVLDKPEGFAKVTFKNGIEYQGLVQGGKPSGFGVFIDKDCKDFVLTGPCTEGQPSGKDMIIFKEQNPYNFEIYSGDHVGGMMQGKGDLAFENGKQNSGNLKKNHVHGLSKCVLPDGTIYMGKFRYDLPFEFGVMIYQNDDIYFG